LLLALAERIDQALWCLLTATEPDCHRKARTEATLEAQKFAQEADTLLHGHNDQVGDPDLHELLCAVNLAVSDLADGLLHNGPQFIAAVRTKVPDATEGEILAAVRYEGALQMREVEQINRHMAAQGMSVDGDDIDTPLAEPYIHAAVLLERHINDALPATA
jgi:hypothetical protein